MNFEEGNNAPAEKSTAFSRREWLGKVSIPALSAVAAGLIAPSVMASENSKPNVEELKITGTRIFNVRDFGAKGDGKTLDTAAVQKAIDTCNQQKGGTVLVPPGDFVIGTVELKSHVTLNISANGKLLGSPKREDYSAGKGVPTNNGNVVLLYAANAENVTIEGKGTIDGNGAAFYTGQGDNTGPNSPGGGYFDRPHLLIFYKCQNLLLRDSFYTKSAYHCCRILECEQVNIDNVHIYNRVNKNNDGFHLNSNKYVHIVNCDVRCQDDACALFGSNQFITITNCSFSTRWSIFRFGGGEAQNIAISNCLIYETYGCPIKISTGRGRLENLTFSNIVMRNVTGPIGIGFGGSSNNSTPPPAPGEKFFVRNISFDGIRATVVPKPVNHPDIPFDVKVYDGELNSCITLNGVGENVIENVGFSNIHVKYAGGGSKEQAAKKDIPQVSAEYFGVWGTAPGGPPAYGMYARNVKNLTLHNVRLEYESAEARPAIVFDNVHDCSINGLAVQGSSADSALRFTRSTDILLSGIRLLSPCNAFLKLEGSGNEGITLDGGDLRKASKPVIFEGGAGEKAVKLRA